MRRSTFAAAAAAGALLLGGCTGGGEDLLASVEAETEPGDDGIVSMTGSDALRYNTAAVTAPAGEIGFELTCGTAVNHNLVIEGENDGDPIASCDRGAEGEPGFVTLEPGIYTYVCDIPGHRITMNGELTVTG